MKHQAIRAECAVRCARCPAEEILSSSRVKLVQLRARSYLSKVLKRVAAIVKPSSGHLHILGHEDHPAAEQTLPPLPSVFA
jgi:hypothetical protein